MPLSLVYARAGSQRPCYFYGLLSVYFSTSIYEGSVRTKTEEQISPVSQRCLHVNWKERTEYFCILSYRAGACYFSP